MPKFVANVTTTRSFTIEAEDEDEARQIADDAIADGRDPGEEMTNAYDTNVSIFEGEEDSADA